MKHEASLEQRTAVFRDTHEGKTARTTGQILSFVRRFRWPLLLFGALLTGFCVIYPPIGLLEWVSLLPSAAVLFVMASDPSVRIRSLWGMGFAFFEVYYLVAFHWFLYMYPLDFAGLTAGGSMVVVIVAWIGLSGLQAMTASLVFPLFGVAVRGDFLRRHPLTQPFLFACLFAAWEMIEANCGFGGVPWGRLPLGQESFLPMLQSASLFGSYFVTFLLVAVNGLLAFFVLHAGRRTVSGVVAGSLFLANLAFGAGRMAVLSHRDRNMPDSDRLTVAAVQGNMSSHEKWGYESLETAKRIYGEESRKAAAAGADLIVWPETALPASIDDSASLRTYLTDLSVSCGVPILAGVFTGGEGGDYNSVVAALPDGTIHEKAYHKRNLVPFGEFVPWRNLIMTLIPPLAEIGMLDEDVLPGKESTVIPLSIGGQTVGVAPLICFDSIYERNTVEASRRGAELFVVSTNDSWFKDSRGIRMHNAQAKLRAVETGNCVVRAANTGISSVITPLGRETAHLDVYQRGYVAGTVLPSRTRTGYTVIGNTFAWMSLAVSAAACVLPLAERLVRAHRKTRETGFSQDRSGGQPD